MNTEEVHGMLKLLPLAVEMGSTSESKPARLNEALMDLMNRHGNVMDEIFQNSAEGPALSNVGPGGEVIVPGGIHGGAQGTKMCIKLRLERARGIGQIDLTKGADLFCVAFVVDSRSGQGLRGLLNGNRLFQTKVMRGSTEEDWTWNEVSALPLDYL
jgi:hypothetical protein